MISVFSYNKDQEEQNIVEKGCRRETARRTEEKLAFTKAMSLKEIPLESAGEKLTDIIFYEVCSKADVESLRRFRPKEPGAMLMLLASASVSPVQYLKPGISPDMLLLKPFDQKMFDTANKELFDAFLSRLSIPDETENFVLNTRDGKTLIPYSKIIYFEASNKKINLRVGNQEYDFYGSIENLVNVVPEYFVRCHRAYLVNRKKIRTVRLSEGLIEMEGGISVVLSRTYKQYFKTLTK